MSDKDNPNLNNTCFIAEISVRSAYAHTNPNDPTNKSKHLKRIRAAMFYYKEKRMSLLGGSAFFKMELSAMLMKNNRRLCLAGVIVIFLIYYFYNLLKSADSHIISELDLMNQLSENRRMEAVGSSIIIDALQPKEDLDLLPIHTLVSPYKDGMFIYNLEESTESWWPFECLNTKMKNSLNTKLCIHEPKFDNHISGQLKEHGLWEPTNVRTFMRQLSEVPDANVIDIGANIGLYTLLAAKLDRFVIAVEPLHENLNRLHKAAQLEKVESRVVALVNAVSNERAEVKVSILDFNIGGAFIFEPELENHTDKANEQISSSVIVNSITMNDLIEVINDKLNNKSLQLSQKQLSKKLVIKLDIEGYEPYAFEQSERLFTEMQVVAVFLEFGKILENLQALNFDSKSVYLKKTKNMLNMFKRHGFEPYEINGINKLEFADWKSWPWDIYLRKCDLVNCPGFTYKMQGVSLAS